MMDWKVDGVATRNMSHRECCLYFVKDREEFEQDPNGAVVRARDFPWAKHHDITGVFFLKDFLASRGISERIGYWASTHLVGDDSTGWCHGNMLLFKSLPSIKEGWVLLKDEEIPSGPAPCRPIYSWAQYVKLRNLCRSSIAPLLLTNVLTIYQMIIHEFKLRRRRPRNGEFFVIYVLGAKRELDYLPLLEELAYLFPKGTDVELRFVSPAVKHLVDKALHGHPKSYLRTCGDYVIDKSAPDGGRVRVSLKGQHALFHEIKLLSAPDAVIGLNAGIADYVEWPDTILRLLVLEIPFSFSEPTRHSLRCVRDKLMPMWTERYNADSHGTIPKVKAPNKLKIRLNPFHGIVERNQVTLLTPNISNGYLLTWKAPLPPLLTKSKRG
jgi:hypothetical protein